jgi:hypothetical protein
MKRLSYIAAALSVLFILILSGCTNPSGQSSAQKGTDTSATAQSGLLPQASADVEMHPEYAKTLARFAYVWGYPMVNMLNRSIRIGKAPHPGRLGGVLPAAPTGQICMLDDYIDPGQTFIACPNQDVVYGLGFFELDKQPVIIQVPDFGDRFWVYAMYDSRTDQIADLGTPNGSKPGFYL